jgi:hypothetical protein
MLLRHSFLQACKNVALEHLKFGSCIVSGFFFCISSFLVMDSPVTSIFEPKKDEVSCLKKNYLRFLLFGGNDI